MSKTKAHVRYRNKAGKIIPGVTTITGVMAKPALKNWANKLGLDGIYVRKYVDTLADAGTLAHKMIECHVKGVKCYTDEYSKNDIDLASNSFLKFLEWEKKHPNYKLIASEKQLISEEHQYGGTIDLLYRDIETDKYLLVDIKTAKAIYSEMETQVSGGYGILMRENGVIIDKHYILRIGRTEEEGYEYKEIKKVDKHQERFIICRQLYELNKVLK